MNNICAKFWLETNMNNKNKIKLFNDLCVNLNNSCSGQSVASTAFMVNSQRCMVTIHGISKKLGISQDVSISLHFKCTCVMNFRLHSCARSTQGNNSNISTMYRFSWVISFFRIEKRPFLSDLTAIFQTTVWSAHASRTFACAAAHA